MLEMKPGIYGLVDIPQHFTAGEHKKSPRPVGAVCPALAAAVAWLY